jgi:5'-methylthioadenosine phosphorylase
MFKTKKVDWKDIRRDYRDNPCRMGVRGGTGCYEMEGLEKIDEFRMETPYGLSTDIIVGDLEGKLVAFELRHGKGHVRDPSHVNYLADFFAYKALGTEKVIATSACGSLRELIEPGENILIPDQVIKKTFSRPTSFFGEGIVAHVGVDNPFCPYLRDRLVKASLALKYHTHVEGIYVCIEGPDYSTKAESRIHQGQGISVVGETIVPEFNLARQAEICYGVIALPTDYDVWYLGHEVSTEDVVKVIRENAWKATNIAREVISNEYDRKRGCNHNGKLNGKDKTSLCECGAMRCGCESALSKAILTNPEMVRWQLRNDPQMREKFGLLVEKYFSLD